MAGRRGKQLDPSLEASHRAKSGLGTQPSPRASAAGAARSSRLSEPVTGLVLRKSLARRKLEQREQEHERLLQQIARGKARCDVLESLVRDAQALLQAQTEGLRARVTASLRQLHRALDALLGSKSRLRRKDREELRLFCQEVLGGLPRPEELEEEELGEREQPAEEAHTAPGAESGSAGAPGVELGDERHHATAPKPSQDAELLRSLYRKLTLALHPDRAKDPAEAARLTALMKDVTRAYASEDLAQLMELERTWLAQGASDVEQELEARSARLQAVNRELRVQLRGLATRLKEGERWLPDVTWTTRAGPADARELAAGIGGMLERELRQVEGWRDAARALAAGQISVLQFMLGPRAAPGEDPLADALEELLEVAPRRPRAAPRRRSPR
ncbi:MAG: hypothetical protein RL685_4761 [Pseudomonadota bacterium]